MCVKGNGASISALRESGVDAADVLIAATSMDEVNMVCCLTAKRLGAKYTIARVRNVEYAMELSLLKEALGIDLVINPENAAAAEIAMARRIGTRRSGRMSMMSAGTSAHGEMTKLSARAPSMVSSTVTMGLRKESTV